METTVTIDGLGPILKRLDRLGDRAPIVMGSILYEEGQGVKSEAIPITPIDTGALRGSAKVDGPEPIADGQQVRIGFGGAAVPYAVYVHEDLTKYHKPPTRAKFLEVAYKRRLRGMLGRIARRVRRELAT